MGEKKKASCIIRFSETCIVKQNLILWNSREFIKGTITSSIQIKYSNLTTAFEFLSSNLFNCWLVQNDIYSKRILEEGNLEKRIFIIPLDNISLPFKKTFQKTFEKDCSYFLSFEEKLLKAIRFVFGGIKIAKDILQAKKIAFSDENSFSCVTLEGEKFEPYGSIIAGKNEESGFSILTLCSEINNFKQKFVRIGGIFKKTNTKNIKFFGLNFYQGTKNKLKNILRENNRIKIEANSHRLSFLLLSSADKKKTILNSYQKKIKQNLSQREIDQVSTSKFFFHFFPKKKKEKKQHERGGIFNKRLKLSKKIKILSHRILKKIKNFEEMKIFFIEKFGNFQKNFFNCFRIFLLIFIIQTMIAKKQKTIKYHKKIKFKWILSSLGGNLFSLLEKENKIQKKKKNFKFDSSNSSFPFLLLERFKMSLKKKFLQKSFFFLQNSFDFFDIESIRYAMRSSKKYQDLIKKRATVEKDRLIIEDIIEKLDQKKKEILNQNIRKINSSFQRIFKLLIPGWSARLVSIRSKNGSWRGINFSIYFGKTKKKTLKELSGGQKSILALSLIFSILISKPVPFYILDEIDAALDICYTENIGKIIKTNMQISQFIVVSLKRGIIENSNVIFKVESIKGKSFITRIEKKLEKPD